MPNLASDSFPSIEGFLTRCLSELPEEEIAAEISRQIARFEDHAGCKPDFVDGHQHVHVLPGVRSAFVRVLAAHFPDGVLVRDPSDTLLSILSRGGPIWKALSVAGLATGFGTSVRCIGLTTNYGFAGFSSFGRTKPFAKELKSFFRNPGRRHLVMCHPGYPDAELERLDRVVSRRRDELCCLLQATTLPNAIWHLQARDNLDRPIWPGDDPLPRRVVYDSAP